MIYFIGWTADYDKHMIKNLPKSMPVKVINFPEGRFIFQLNKRAHYLLNKIYLLCCSLRVGSNDVLIYKDSDGYGYLKNINVLRGHKVVAIRNIVDESKIEFFKKKFECIYSFDESQCIKYSLKHMEQIFTPDTVEYKKSSNEKVCFFIGIDKGRLLLVSGIAKILNSYDIKCDFRVIKDTSSIAESGLYCKQGITYSENTKYVKKCDILLEINQAGQKGLTLRSLEAAFYGKKLITNNESIRYNSFYDPSRIFIFSSLDEWDYAGFEYFLSASYKPIPDSILDKYKFSTFVEEISKNYA